MSIYKITYRGAMNGAEEVIEFREIEADDAGWDCGMPLDSPALFWMYRRVETGRNLLGLPVEHHDRVLVIPLASLVSVESSEACAKKPRQPSVLSGDCLAPGPRVEHDVPNGWGCSPVCALRTGHPYDHRYISEFGFKIEWAQSVMEAT